MNELIKYDRRPWEEGWITEECGCATRELELLEKWPDGTEVFGGFGRRRCKPHDREYKIWLEKQRAELRERLYGPG